MPDRPVLVSNLVSGGLFLLYVTVFGYWPVALFGAVYVVAVSLFLATAYGREDLTMRQEALVWMAPWLVAVALWVLILTGFSRGDSGAGWLLPLWFGLVVTTPCYLAWQLVALALRQFMAWRSTS